MLEGAHHHQHGMEGSGHHSTVSMTMRNVTEADSTGHKLSVCVWWSPSLVQVGKHCIDVYSNPDTSCSTLLFDHRQVITLRTLSFGPVL